MISDAVAGTLIDEAAAQLKSRPIAISNYQPPSIPGISSNRRLAFALAAAIAALQAHDASATALPFGVFPIDGTYIGTLPCSDCSGIRTELTLHDVGINAGKGSGDFKLVERFYNVSRHRASAVTRGTWFLVNHRTDGYYQESGTIELRARSSPDTSPRLLFFKCTLGQTVEALDRRMQPFTEPTPHTLLRLGLNHSAL